MTTYNPIIPQPTDNLSTSQGQILGNFTQLNTQFAVNHTAFNTGSGNGDGKHKFVTLPGTSSDPFTPLTAEGIVYTKTATSITKLLYVNERLTSLYLLNCVKAWGVFNGATVGTNAPTDGYNVTSVQRTGVGTYVVTMTIALPNADYAVIASGQTPSNFGTAASPGISTRTTTTFQINCVDAVNIGGLDSNPISFAVIQS